MTFQFCSCFRLPQFKEELKSGAVPNIRKVSTCNDKICYLLYREGAAINLLHLSNLRSSIYTTEDRPQHFSLMSRNAPTVIRCIYYINTNEIPSELSSENMISSHVKRSLLLWLHIKIAPFGAFCGMI